MKFWELAAIMRSEHAVLELCLRKNEWVAYYDWYMNFDKIVNTQQRDKLDAVMPEALLREVMSASRQTFFLYGGSLRSYRFTKDDLELPALIAFERFGGKALEEALEYGSFKVDPPTNGP